MNSTELQDEVTPKTSAEKATKKKTKKAAKKKTKKTTTAATTATKKAAKKKTKKTTKKGREKDANPLSGTSEDGGSQKGVPWSFPRHTLEESIKIAQAIEEKNAGKDLPADTLANALGYSQAVDWRFRDLLRSANQYGLVSGSGAKARVALEPVGQDIVAPSTPHQRQQGLLRAFQNVELFASVESYYSGKRLPSDEYLVNTLTREFRIPRDRVEVFIRVFTKNLEYLKILSSREFGEPVVRAAVVGATVEKPEEEVPNAEATREFIETCFMLMPFGGYFDRYYKDIYVPAIKQAGFEPVRADDLFESGSVIDQISERITKSRVLLAELTGKNPNVFYELGLAHAGGKPVVLVSQTIDDVPFDLRHLRVITYDVKAPDWAAQLRRDVIEYLKTAKSDPERSIPTTFRRAKET